MDVIYNELFVSLTMNDIFIRLLFGCLIGFCLGLTGVGGGVLIIPVLQVVFGLSPVMAVGTASMIASLIKVNATISHVVAKNVSWKEVVYILVGAIPVTFFVAELIVNLTKVPEYSIMVNNVVQMLILSIMLFALISMILKLIKVRNGEVSTKEITSNKMKGIGSGAACGAIMASTGVGGGVLILPTLNSILGVDIKRSVGSSIVIALVLSGISAVKYSNGGQSDVVTAIILVAGSFAGVPIALRAVKKLSDSGMYITTIAIISVSLILTLTGQ